MSYLYYTLRGIRRSQGDSFNRQSRAPITIQHLWDMSAFIHDSAFTEHDKAMWRSVILCAFFGLLRVSEFTTASQNFDPTTHLSPHDITFNEAFSIMYVYIKSSKTDPFRVGVTIRLAAIANHRLCPVQAMRLYLTFREHTNGPLFRFSNGVSLTRRFVSAFLLLSLPGVCNINTHSFRIGGASAAFAAGASDALIRTMGRWNSDCFHRYLRLQDRTITATSNTMSASDATSVWSPDH